VKSEIVGVSGKAEVEDCVAGYEAPEMVALGNLHDLLAGDLGTLCDADGNITSGAGSGTGMALPPGLC